jgi:hypothetical protein
VTAENYSFNVAGQLLATTCQLAAILEERDSLNPTHWLRTNAGGRLDVVVAESESPTGTRSASVR